MKTTARIECVPNFSEGQRPEVIEAIAQSIRNVDGVELLHIDVGPAANRTVMTFVACPSQVVEAAFAAIKTASERIDMRLHRGEHPRIGATDVCPLVPLSGVSLEETVVYARQLAERVGNELGIPVYCYEAAAFQESRRNLAHCRAGEYEGLMKKLSDPKWVPDFGPPMFHAKSGLTVIGARPFLGAYNVNLDTQEVELAKEIAKEVRRPPYLKAIGWYIKEYACTQVSMNLCNLDVWNLHQAFERVQMIAQKHGVGLRGSELIGMLPRHYLVESGKYFAMQSGDGVTEKGDEDYVRLAVLRLGLDALAPFDAGAKLIQV